MGRDGRSGGDEALRLFTGGDMGGRGAATKQHGLKTYRSLCTGTRRAREGLRRGREEAPARKERLLAWLSPAKSSGGQKEDYAGILWGRTWLYAAQLGARLAPPPSYIVLTCPPRALPARGAPLLPGSTRFPVGAFAALPPCIDICRRGIASVFARYRAAGR